MAKTEEEQEIFEALASSKMYSDYRDAFGKATGVPLTLHQGGECKRVQYSKTEKVPFCTLMAHTKRACADCYKLQSQLELRAGAEARALYCFAGLLLRLLSVFAEHLAACANRLKMERKPVRFGPVGKAKRLVEERSQEHISLIEVASAVNVSATYFSRLFRQATGMTFVDFVARYRIEKAKNLLQDPHWRISEVAFEVGFQSLSQFNRSFRRIEGQSPKQYRAAIAKSLR